MAGVFWMLNGSGIIGALRPRVVLKVSSWGPFTANPGEDVFIWPSPSPRLVSERRLMPSGSVCRSERLAPRPASHAFHARCATESLDLPLPLDSDCVGPVAACCWWSVEAPDTTEAEVEIAWPVFGTVLLVGRSPISNMAFVTALSYPVSCRTKLPGIGAETSSMPASCSELRFRRLRKT